jgi:hypothetical protein
MPMSSVFELVKLQKAEPEIKYATRHQLTSGEILTSPVTVTWIESVLLRHTFEIKQDPTHVADTRLVDREHSYALVSQVG